MGQKCHPTALRLGVIFTEDSIWYSDKFKYSDLLLEDHKIRNFIKQRLYRSGVSKIIIKRRAKQVEIDIYTARPGVIIGKGGEEVDRLKKEITDLINKKIQLNILEEPNIDTNAQLLAENVAMQIERRISHKRAMKQIITRSLKGGALGVKVRCAGRLGGAEIARAEWYREGRVPLHTLRANIDYGFTEALTTYGKIGIKVWVYKGEVLDKGKQQWEDRVMTPAPSGGKQP